MPHAKAQPVDYYLRVARAGLGYSRARLTEALDFGRETIERLAGAEPTS